MRDELKRRKHEKQSDHAEARNNYYELLEFIHTRYDHKRADDPNRTINLSPHESKLMHGEGDNLLRLPCELERRFLEILFVIIEDSWELPSGAQWIELLEFLKAFQSDSQLFVLDNPLNDCYKFFSKASQLFNFEEQFLHKC